MTSGAAVPDMDLGEVVFIAGLLSSLQSMPRGALMLFGAGWFLIHDIGPVTSPLMMRC